MFVQKYKKDYDNDSNRKDYKFNVLFYSFSEEHQHKAYKEKSCPPAHKACKEKLKEIHF